MKTDPDLFSATVNADQHGRNRRLGWFVAGAVLIVIAAVAFMAVQKGLFKRTTQLHFVADSAKGMVPGMAVKLNGFKVGTLEKLAMDADGRVSIVLALGDEYVPLIHKDAKARLVKEDLIGESIIDVLPGSANSATVENNAVIAFERARDIGEELSKLANQLQPILADVKSITAYADSPDGDLKKTLQELKRATTAFADTGEVASDLTRRNKKQIQSAITDAANTMASASKAMNTLDTSLPRLIGKLDTSLHHVEGVTADAKAITAEVKAITTDVKTISSGLAAELPPAVSEGRETLQDTHEVVDAVKGSWPINKLLPPQEDHPLPLDSHVPSSR
ncbi:MAG: MlaD family protein [Gallionella sp.]|nr:MlaD family protein [Gallionella sp.]